MKYFSSIRFFLSKAISLILIGLTIACLTLSLSEKDGAYWLQHIQRSEIASAKTILSHGNTTPSDAVSLQKNIFCQNTAAPEESRYYVLSGEDIHGDIILRIKAEETPSFSFQMTDVSGKSYGPSVQEYDPSNRVTKLIYHFSWNQTYYFTVQNLAKDFITYSVQYKKNEITTRKIKRVQPTGTRRKIPVASKPAAIKHKQSNASKPNAIKHKQNTASKSNATKHKQNTASKPAAIKHKQYNASKPNTIKHKQNTASKPNAIKHKQNNASKPTTTNRKHTAASTPSKIRQKKSVAKLTLSKSFLRIAPGKSFQISAVGNQKGSSFHWMIYRKDCLSDKNITNLPDRSTFSAHAVTEGTVVVLCKWKNVSATCTIKISQSAN